MRILVDGMPRGKGGIGSLLVNIAEYSKKHNVLKPDLHFEFIIEGKSGYLTYLKKNNYKFFMAPPVHETIKYYHFLKTLFKENHYDYLWFNNTSKVNLLLPFFAKKNGVKVIAHPHGVDIEEKGFKRLCFKVIDAVNSKAMFSLIDIPFACSIEAANLYYRGNQNLRHNTKIVNNGIDTDNYSFDPKKGKQIRSELDISDDDILLGSVGRLTSVKNYPFIIEALQHLDSHYQMIILGEGEERKRLENLIAEKKLSDRCRLLGDKENISDYLSAMDIYLMPSLNEGMPFSIIEAQCSGLPCIVSDTLSPELRITDLVVYISIDDAKKWAEAIINIDLFHDRFIYSQRISEAGYGIDNAYTILREAIQIGSKHDID